VNFPADGQIFEVVDLLNLIRVSKVESKMRGPAIYRWTKQTFSRDAAMTKFLFSLAVLAAIQISSAPVSRAAQVCLPHEEVSKALSEQYKESRKGLGLSSPTHVVELFVSPTGSWTLAATDTQGNTCVIASGEAWQDAPLTAAEAEL
jgi:hypothetical protein